MKLDRDVIPLPVSLFMRFSLASSLSSALKYSPLYFGCNRYAVIDDSLNILFVTKRWLTISTNLLSVISRRRLSQRWTASAKLVSTLWQTFSSLHTGSISFLPVKGIGRTGARRRWARHEWPTACIGLDLLDRIPLHLDLNTNARQLTDNNGNGK